MKTSLLLFVAIASCTFLQAQTKSPKNYIGVSAGRSFNGSGDLQGLIYSTEFSHQFKKKLSWGISLSGYHS